MAKPNVLRCTCCADTRLWSGRPVVGRWALDGKRCLMLECIQCGGPCRGTYALA